MIGPSPFELLPESISTEAGREYCGDNGKENSQSRIVPEGVERSQAAILNRNLARLGADLLGHPIPDEVQAATIFTQADLFDREPIEVVQSNRVILGDLDAAEMRIIGERNYSFAGQRADSFSQLALYCEVQRCYGDAAEDRRC